MTSDHYHQLLTSFRTNRIKLTSLNLYDGVSVILVLLPRHPAPGDTLDLDSCSLSSNLLDLFLCQDAPPPALDLDRPPTEISVIPHLDPPPHILLHDSDELVEPCRPHALEYRKHTCSEKDFGQTDLVLVLFS